MKNIFASLAIVAMTVLSTSFAHAHNPDKFYNYKAAQYLKEAYGTVENVKWSQMKDGTVRADFSHEESSVTLFFEANGKYVATTQTITPDHLVVPLRKALKKHLGSQKMERLIYFINDKEEAYFFETLQGEVKTIWRMETDGAIQKYK